MAMARKVVSKLVDLCGEYADTDFRDIVLTASSVNTVDFDNCTFTDSDFSESTFTDVVFSDCTFTNCNLSITKYRSSQIKDCTFEGCKLTGIDWQTVTGTLGIVMDCVDCDLSYSAFDQIGIPKSVFKNCKFTEAIFDNANLQKCIFAHCDFTRATFTKCDLKEADLSSASSYYIDICSNNCRKAKFSYPEVLNLLTGAGITITDNPDI